MKKKRETPGRSEDPRLGGGSTTSRAPFLWLALLTFSASSACGDGTGTATDARIGSDGRVATPGITVSPTAGLVTTEIGGWSEFQVVLEGAPSADVTFPVVSNDTSEGTVSVAALVFTTGNWNAPQTVTIKGVDDEDVDGNMVYSVAVGPATSSDSNYDGLGPVAVTLTNLDDESAGIIVTPTEGLVTTEGGGEDSFTVVLQKRPTAGVVVGLSSSDPGEGTISPTSLSFNPDNWNAPRAVTVTGVDDSASDGDQVYRVVAAPAVSDDPEYTDLKGSDVDVTNTDDETAGIRVEPTLGLITTEGGGEEVFIVVLNSQPAADVGIPIASSDVSEGTVSPASLNFTVDNWNAPQTVTITGVDDLLADGNQSYTILLGAASSTDADYAGLDASDVSVSNTDDETAGVTVGPISGNTGEDGSAATFVMALNTPPTANVTIALSSSDEGEGTGSPPSLTFTADNWSAAQTVTVTGVNDSVADGDQPYTIITAAASSTDAQYAGFDADDVSVINIDDDAPGVSVTPTSGLLTNEGGGEDTFTLVLQSQPTSMVQIGISSSDTGEGLVSTSILTFATDNWYVPQTVTVTGVDDAVADGNQIFQIVTAPATSLDPDYHGLDALNVTVTNNDDDSPGTPFTEAATYWPWLETNNVPAYYYNGRTYIAFSLGAPDEDDAGIMYYDHNSHTFSGVVKVGATDLPLGDNHGGPVVVVSDDGRVHVIFGGHGDLGSMKHFASTDPEDISSWGRLSNIVAATTYPSLFKMSDGDMYYSYRGGLHRSDWKIAKSTDDGATWPLLTAILAGGEESGSSHYDNQYGVVGNRYFDSWYAHPQQGVDDTIHVLFTYHACPDDHSGGVGKRQQYNLYYMKFSANDGTWRNRANMNIGSQLPLSLSEADACCLVYESQQKTGSNSDTVQRFYQMQLSVDADDEPYILFVHGTPDDTLPDTSVLVKPNGTSWTRVPLPNDSFVGHLIVNSPTHLEIASPIWRESINGGLTWTEKRRLTDGLGVSLDMSRNPGVLVGNAHPDAQWLFVQGGRSPDDSNVGLYLYGESGFLAP